MSNLLNVPTASGANTPNVAGLASGTGTIDIRALLKLPSWANGSNTQTVMCQFNGNSTQSRWVFEIHADGTLGGFWYNSAATGQSSTSTVPTGFANNSKNWVRVLLNIGAGTAQFFTSADDITYVQLGATITGLSPTLVVPATPTVVTIGELGNSSNLLIGSVFRSRLLIAGTPVFDMDWTTATLGAGPWTSGSGEVWTAVGTATVQVDPSAGPNVSGAGHGALFSSRGIDTSTLSASSVARRR